MPELPEVETVVRDLRKKMRGQTFVSVEVFSSQIIGIGPNSLGIKRSVSSVRARDFRKLLTGQTVLEVKRRAKVLVFELTSDLVLLAHLKMTGQFIFEDEASRKENAGKYRILNKLTAPLVKLPYKHTHAVFSFTSGGKLYFNDVRRFGYLKLLRKSEFFLLQEFLAYGPEPFSARFSFEYFLSEAKKKSKLSVKQFLMDNSVVVGIGNIYSDEILFHARIDPRRKMQEISKRELQKIYDQIKPILKRAIVAKGSSVGDFVRPDGSWGKMGKHHFVYGRKNQPCKVCGFAIQSAKLGGRTSSFCPKCQK